MAPTLGYMILALGMIAWTVGNVMFLAIVFRYSIGWFFGCLMIPFVDLTYFLLYPRQTWKPMLIAAIGLLATGIGALLVGSH